MFEASSRALEPLASCVSETSRKGANCLPPSLGEVLADTCKKNQP
jgi:hypothetical protein